VIKALAGPELTQIEASLAGSLTSLKVEGNVITAVDGSRNFVVAGGCSALANLSQAMLLTVTMGQLFGVTRLRSTMGWALAAAVSVIAINSSRLLALGYWPQHFDYLHEGAGRLLFVLAALAAMCAIAVWGTIHATRPAT
jgi:exosortase/archaeosortase family protein